MKDYSQIIKGMKNSLWLIEETSLQVIVDIVNKRLSGDPFDEEEIRLRIEAAENGDRENSRVEIGGGIGIVPMYGPIFPKANLMTELSGATSLETFRNDLRSLLQNDKVKSIILDIDTPGGASGMVEETGQEIFEARDQKPIYAVANGMACSAGHWLASMATKFYATPSGEVGSIGVCTVHEDISARDEKQGKKVSILTAGEYKAVGNPHEPLTAEGRTYIQERIDGLYGTFIESVAKGRGIDPDVVRTEHAEGKIFSSREAHKLGMIDDVKTLDSVVDELLVQNHAPTVRSTLSSAMARHHSDVLKLEHADMEHSEPGTGSPPERRSDGDITEDEMHRREQVPPAFEEPESEVKKENNMEELLKKLSEKLGLSANAKEEEVLTAVTNMHDELEPLRMAAKEAESRKAFSEEYPHEYKRMQDLEESDRTNKAKAFSTSYARFAITDKEGNVKEGERSTRGFSALVLNDIEEAHMLIATGKFGIENFNNLLNNISRSGIVDYGEGGSSVVKDGVTLTRTDEADTPRQLFANLVGEIMEEDNLSRDDAIKEAARREPELFAQYRNPHVNTGA